MRLILEPLITALIVTVVSVPLLARLAIRLGIVDHPAAEAHKAHQWPTPYLGGIAFHLGFTAALGVVAWRYPALVWEEPWGMKLLALYWAGGAMLIVGLADDIWRMRPITKLICQMTIVSGLVWCGFRIERITNPFNGVPLDLGWFGGGFALLWMVGLVNALNFTDGLDGLAAGVTAAAAAAVVAIALNPWHGFAALVGAIILGVTIGFLPYNWPPAKIFMGDSGSLYLGLMLSATSIVSTSKSAILLTMVILVVPLMDMLLAVVRRSRRGRHPFQGDREHLHHRLINIGLTPAQASWTLVGLACLCSVVAVIASQLPPQVMWIVVAALGGAFAWGFWVFSVLEQRITEIKRNGTPNNRDL